MAKETYSCLARLSFLVNRYTKVAQRFYHPRPLREKCPILNVILLVIPKGSSFQLANSLKLLRFIPPGDMD